MKVIVLGKGELANFVVQYFWMDHGADVIYVPVKPYPEWCEDFESNIPLEVDIIYSGKYWEIPERDVKEADLVISCFYDKIFKKDFIGKCNRIINIHMSPLPKYRGVRPINWVLKNGETEHGVTIHEITPGVDDGPIIAQTKFSIYPEFEEVKDVYKRCINYATLLLTDIFGKHYFDKIVPRRQDESQATHYTMKDEPYLEERRYFTIEESKNASTVG